jgi:hypothetical protein
MNTCNISNILKEELPISNGGTLCLDRQTIDDYAYEKIVEGKVDLSRKIKLIPSVRAFKEAI